MAQQESWRRWVAIPLSIMILFALLFAGAAQAGSSSCTSAAAAAIADITGHDGPLLDADDDVPKQNRSHATLTCCSFACVPSLIAAGIVGEEPALRRHQSLVLSGQSPDTLASEGLKRPPRSILTDYRHA